MAEDSPAVLIARVVPSVCLSGDELETVRAELGDLRRDYEEVSAQLVELRHPESEEQRRLVHALAQAIEARDLAAAALDDVNTEIARLRDAALEVDLYEDFSQPVYTAEDPGPMNAARLALHQLIHQDSPASPEAEGSPTQPPTAAPAEEDAEC